VPQRPLSENGRLLRALTKEVEIQLNILRGNWEDNEVTPNVRNLRKALRRIVEIGFRTTSAPDLRHVSWNSDIADKVIACSVGLGIASADIDRSDPALHIAHCAYYLETQGCGPEMLRYYTMLSIDEYHAKPDADLGILVRVARDAMEAYLDGDRSALESLKSVLH
jgi:hypothetical protein